MGKQTAVSRTKEKGSAKGKAAAKIEAELRHVREKVVDDLAQPPVSIAKHLRFVAGTSLADIDPSSTPGFEGKKADGRAALAAGAEQLSALQEKLFAEGRGGGERSLLLVIQGMDTSGKGGIMRHVVGAVDPQGVRHTTFKAPNAEERSHQVLWRIRRALPVPGEIGVFDRSHYEDVLIVRVHKMVSRQVWLGRYDSINTFEAGLVADGTTVVKVMLHVSRDEQKARLTERLERPDKYWKYSPADVDERARWEDYQQAYGDALERCSTDAAPWYVVPADHKWYARWAVQQLLIDRLEEMDPQWPPADFDIEAEKLRLAAT